MIFNCFSATAMNGLFAQKKMAATNVNVKLTLLETDLNAKIFLNVTIQTRVTYKQHVLK